jgi:hypothetical protein
LLGFFMAVNQAKGSQVSRSATYFQAPSSRGGQFCGKSGEFLTVSQLFLHYSLSLQGEI